MQTIATQADRMTSGSDAARPIDYSYQAYLLLYWGFIAAPLLAGVDKFFQFLANWDLYLSPTMANLGARVGLSAHSLMQVVGGIEIGAALLVALKPRVGAYVVAAWLMGIIINLLLIPGYYDVALRDFGLFLAAIALGRLSQNYSH